MAVLRPGRCCSRPQRGCLQHRTEAQRRPKGQDAGGTPALPGQSLPPVDHYGPVPFAVPIVAELRGKGNHSPLRGSRRSRAARRRLMRWGVGAGRLLRMPTCTLWETPVCPRAAPALPCGSFQEKQPIVNEDEPRMDTKEHEETWTSFNHKRHQNASANWCPWCDFVSLALFHGLTPTAPCGRRIRGLIRTPGLAPGDYLFENRSPHAMSGLLESGSAVVGVAHPTKCLLQDFLPVKGIRPVAG